MATLDEKIAKIEEAMSTGVRVVNFGGGHRVEYQDSAEMLRALEYFKQQKRNQAGRGGVRVTVGAFHRG